MASSAPIRQLPREIVAEAKLTEARFMIVEGPTDQRFFEVWCKQLGVNCQVRVMAVERVEVDAAELYRRGLSEGNRGRVIALAHLLDDSADRVVCIADMDVGQELAGNESEYLKLTDYPALESYCLESSTLEHANKILFAGKLPEPDVLLPSISFALRELFAIRLMHPDLDQPNFDRGLAASANDLSGFDVKAAVAPHVAAKCSAYRRPNDADPRNYAYGHDIGSLLFSAFKNQLKNGAGLLTVEAVEASLRSAMLATGDFVDESLFVYLRGWLAKSSSNSDQ